MYIYIYIGIIDTWYNIDIRCRVTGRIRNRKKDKNDSLTESWFVYYYVTLILKYIGCYYFGFTHYYYLLFTIRCKIFIDHTPIRWIFCLHILLRCRVPRKTLVYIYYSYYSYHLSVSNAVSVPHKRIGTSFPLLMK